MLVSVALVELITNDVLAVILAVGTLRKPCVPPGVATVMNILLDAVTAVVLTVTVPPTSVDVPIEAFDPVVIFILLPAVVNSRLPLIWAA